MLFYGGKVNVNPVQCRIHKKNMGLVPLCILPAFGDLQVRSLLKQSWHVSILKSFSSYFLSSFEMLYAF